MLWNWRWNGRDDVGRDAERPQADARPRWFGHDVGGMDMIGWAFNGMNR